MGERRRLTEESEDEVQLLLDRGAGKEGPPCGHLVVDAAHAPAGSNGQGRVRLGLLVPALSRAAPPQCPAVAQIGPGAGAGDRRQWRLLAQPSPPLPLLSGGFSGTSWPLPFHSVGFGPAQPAPI